MTDKPTSVPFVRNFDVETEDPVNGIVSGTCIQLILNRDFITSIPVDALLTESNYYYYYYPLIVYLM